MKSTGRENWKEEIDNINTYKFACSFYILTTGFSVLEIIIELSKQLCNLAVRSGLGRLVVSWEYIEVKVPQSSHSIARFLLQPLCILLHY
jgi:hypothetical protein